MVLFAIIETEAGLTVAETGPDGRAEEAAARHGGIVVDPGPYKSYEDAYEALLALECDEEDAQHG
ncbi:MAG TPA: hypothetical protein EYP56_00195 [Planctomycetaceae bacterium]|nr:hypothetical protein [Planctomycetaceae bacterium]HIQ21757.1 hypothetical protein [Planctomycetota bacterium]